MMMVGDRLELLGREEAECGVPAAAVEEDLDVLEDLRAQLGLRWPAAAVDELLLEGREEALGDGVVVAVTAAAHRVLEVARDLQGAARVGLSEQRDAINAAIERLSDLQGWLETIEYGARFDPVEIPLEVLFPPVVEGDDVPTCC
jgi:phage-related tail protein